MEGRAAWTIWAQGQEARDRWGRREGFQNTFSEPFPTAPLWEGSSFPAKGVSIPTTCVRPCGPWGWSAGKGLAWSISSWGPRTFRGLAVAEEEPEEVVKAEFRFSVCLFPSFGRGQVTLSTSVFPFVKWGNNRFAVEF